MKPQYVDKYTPRVEEVAEDYANIISRQLGKQLDAGRGTDGWARVPVEELSYAMSTEGIGAVIFDMRVGVLGEAISRQGAEFVSTLKNVFGVATELVMSIPLYRYIDTPAWKKYCAG